MEFVLVSSAVGSVKKWNVQCVQSVPQSLFSLISVLVPH